MIDSAKLRRAVAAAQAILRETDPALIVDGKPGGYTKSVYDRAGSETKSAVDSVMAALGVTGSMTAAYNYYRQSIEAAVAKPVGDGARAIFDLQIVPAITREARRRGLNPVNHITQLALETGYGKAMPVNDDGTPSYNAGGIKWDSVKTDSYVLANTREVVNGRSVATRAKFASFKTAEAFAAAYFDYLLNGPSAYRYKGLTAAKTPLEFGSVLQKGGYATDPEYARKFASIANSVSAKYSLA